MTTTKTVKQRQWATGQQGSSGGGNTQYRNSGGYISQTGNVRSRNRAIGEARLKAAFPTATKSKISQFLVSQPVKPASTQKLRFSIDSERLRQDDRQQRDAGRFEVEEEAEGEFVLGGDSSLSLVPQSGMGGLGLSVTELKDEDSLSELEKALRRNELRYNRGGGGERRLVGIAGTRTVTECLKCGKEKTTVHTLTEEEKEKIAAALGVERIHGESGRREEAREYSIKKEQDRSPLHSGAGSTTMREHSTESRYSGSTQYSSSGGGSQYSETQQRGSGGEAGGTSYYIAETGKTLNRPEDVEDAVRKETSRSSVTYTRKEYSSSSSSATTRKPTWWERRPYYTPSTTTPRPSTYRYYGGSDSRYSGSSNIIRGSESYYTTTTTTPRPTTSRYYSGSDSRYIGSNTVRGSQSSVDRYSGGSGVKTVGSSGSRYSSESSYSSSTYGGSGVKTDSSSSGTGIKTGEGSSWSSRWSSLGSKAGEHSRSSLGSTSSRDYTSQSSNTYGSRPSSGSTRYSYSRTYSSHSSNQSKPPAAYTTTTTTTTTPRSYGTSGLDIPAVRPSYFDHDRRMDEARRKLYALAEHERTGSSAERTYNALEMERSAFFTRLDEARRNLYALPIEQRRGSAAEELFNALERDRNRFFRNSEQWRYSSSRSSSGSDWRGGLQDFADQQRRKIGQGGEFERSSSSHSSYSSVSRGGEPPVSRSTYEAHERETKRGSGRPSVTVETHHVRNADLSPQPGGLEEFEKTIREGGERERVVESFSRPLSPEEIRRSLSQDGLKIRKRR